MSRTTAILIAISIALCLPSADAQTFTVLYSFQGGADGSNPTSGLVMDAQGNLYGTTFNGGTNNNGTVFKLSGGMEQVLYHFRGRPDGSEPNGSLIFDRQGNLYGVTAGGGKGCGTVYKITPSGQETVIYSFCPSGQIDGSEPSGALVMDQAGNLYGTTVLGGSEGSGTVFRIDSSGRETILYTFCTKGGNLCLDGEEPDGALTADSNGNLYGTTLVNFGPRFHGQGGVFRLTGVGKGQLLHRFCGNSTRDGCAPNAAMIFDSAGNLYGTTSAGGRNGSGTIFQLSVNEHDREGSLYNFCSAPNCADGSSPAAGLLMDATSNLYGTTFHGGDLTCAQGSSSGCGTVFELSPSGELTVLHTFSGVPPDGAFSSSALIMDKAGNLYGTASSGGASGNGIVFEITR